MIKIIADTTSGLPLDLARQHGIAMLPQIVIFGENSYRDDTEIDTETFLTKLKASSILPKTAAPPPVLYHPIFQAALEKDETVIVIAPSAKISGTVRSVQTAAADFRQKNDADQSDKGGIMKRQDVQEFWNLGDFHYADKTLDWRTVKWEGEEVPKEKVSGPAF